MKDHKCIVSTGTVDRFIASDLYDDVNIYPGALLDNYIFSGTERTGFRKIKPRKYIIIRECFKNAYESCHQMIFTDKKDRMEAYRDIFKDGRDEDEDFDDDLDADTDHK